MTRMKTCLITEIYLRDISHVNRHILKEKNNKI
jgi:hypothetical protein